MERKIIVSAIIVILVLSSSCVAGLNIGTKTVNDSAFLNTNDDKQRYAVLVNGGGTSFSDELNFMYETLTLVQNFTADNIYVYDWIGESSISDGAATKDNIKNICSILKEKMDNDDILFFWYTGHGSGYWKGSRSLVAPHVEPGDEKDYPEDEFSLPTYLYKGLGSWIYCDYNPPEGHGIYRYKYLSSFSSVSYTHLRAHET